MLRWPILMLHMSFTRVTSDTLIVFSAAGLVWKNQHDFTYLCGPSAEMAGRLSSAGPFFFLHIFSRSFQMLSPEDSQSS